jgi:nucleoside-diphosphate-sugar epimerase
MTKDRVLITGAGGFVAGHLAAGLAAMGHRVTALDTGFDAATRARLSDVALVEADLAAAEGVLRDLPAAQVVIHGAALTTNPAAMGMTAAEHVTANTLPLLTMLRHAARIRPRAFVFLSSSGVFGEGDGFPELSEADRPTAQGPYSAAKRAGEALVPGALGEVCATHVLRLGYLYGPAEAPRRTRAGISMLQAWVEAARAGGVLRVAANDPHRDWTFVPDLAPAIARLSAGPGSA